jgi:hypothetical protein
MQEIASHVDPATAESDRGVEKSAEREEQARSEDRQHQPYGDGVDVTPRI